MNIQKTSKVSYIVFGVSLVIVLASLSSVFFPSLLISTIIDPVSKVDPFVTGALFLPVLISNLIILAFGILYYTKKLPNPIKNSFNFLVNFEVSKNVALFVVVSIIFGYIGTAMIDSANDESKQLGDFDGVLLAVENWPFGEEGIPSLKVLHAKNFLLSASLFLFNNIKIIPFLGSVSLLILTYFFTKELAKKRFAGIVAMLIVFQSYIFLRFDTVATYSNFWTLFYLLSLYLILKKWQLSPISYIASIFSKPLTAVFLPMTFFFIYRSEITRKKKIQVTIAYVIIVAVAVAGIFLTNVDLGGGVTSGKINFDIYNFVAGLSTWGYQLRFDTLFLMLILPVTVGLFLVSRKGLHQADSALVLIAGIILAMPLLAALTTVNLHPYRYVPLLVFFAIGVGTLLSRKITQQE